MQTLIDVILPVFLVIGFGYVAVWRGLFPVSGIDGVMKFEKAKAQFLNKDRELPSLTRFLGRLRYPAR